MSESRQPVTVSQLNRQAKRLLESGLARVWVEGEISNLARPASGHVYFRLKDSGAQVAAAFFRQRQRGPTIRLKDGDQVLVYAKVSLYEARGDYQLIVEQVEPAGEGILKRQYERLKNKLAAEGLFDEERKRPIPALPGRIGVITSPSGAAVRDILSVLGRRFPLIPVVIYPAAVQGDAAPGELVAALDTANERNECDVLIVGRGGGSLEDLWAFNDERLARRIVDSDIPVVSAVGHEVDFTIADFVADVRAPTPSGAAELVVPDQEDWIRRFDVLGDRIVRNGQRTLEDRAQSLDWLQRRLIGASPMARLRNQSDLLRELRARLRSGVREHLNDKSQHLQSLRATLMQLSPAVRVEKFSGRLDALHRRAVTAVATFLSDRNHRTELAARALHSVSPLATLNRGYAIVTEPKTGKALLDTKKVRKGDTIEARLANGTLTAKVTDKS
ncbi:MAG: exodeoxyribonuclease VII large subunit [Woeseiaceae bacterium]|nr:exodeoxyribonuclease VII large subunit [Woeseiaceae bacterium]